ncbi:integrase family protein [Desulfovibrio sp. X2]|uniref:site-specific integrase n=1 Tax=Desulfovibrio sp. X2 TaxID=941449 RepID=UPI000358D13B|nr:site-specific integrase [Desulfovibrio sp. X2]EPR37097.1 integrase family protein [Desulfovibrio sp. X2]
MATVTIATRSLQKGKSYVVHYLDPKTGRKVYHKTFRRKDLAQEEINRLRAMLDAGKLPEKAGKRESVATTFGQAAEYCQAEWIRKRREGELTMTTYTGYEYLLKPILAEWRHVLLENLSIETIRDYRAAVAEARSNVLANRRLFVIKQVFAMAKAKGLIEHDVAAGIRNLSEKKHERTRHLTPEEVGRLLAVAEQGYSRHYMPLAILLAVEHGCSTQEILGLQWADVWPDEGQGLITFHREKNGVTRTHKLMPRTRDALLARREYLDRYRRTRGVAVKGDHVIGNMDGTPFASIRKAWNTICKAAGFVDLHFHDHRHTYCTNILLVGGTLKQASVMIGHKDPRMTNRYSNLEGILENPVQDRLAERYAAGRKVG